MFCLKWEGEREGGERGRRIERKKRKRRREGGRREEGRREMIVFERSVW